MQLQLLLLQLLNVLVPAVTWVDPRVGPLNLDLEKNRVAL